MPYEGQFMSSHSDHVAYEMERPAPFARQQRAGYELTLRVVPLEEVVPHEHYHGRRVAELAARLAEEGKLINPPIVAQQGHRYVVLDGATRLTALRQLGYSCIIVQLVDIAQQQVQLTSWNHAVYGGNQAALLAALRGIAGLHLTPIVASALTSSELPEGALGYLMTADKTSFVLETSPRSAPEIGAEWLRLLNDIVAAYGEWGNVERTLSNDVEQLASQFPDFAALVIFPRFRPQTLLALAEQGRTVPAGITRFVIPGRILRLNAPLAKLAADEPLAAKQAWLDNLISEKLLERQVRYYEEPVVLLDE
jgi:hypothetical protein